MPELLLEIGCEELPAPWLEPLARGLRASFGNAARRERLMRDDGGVATFWTPRRLVLAAEVLARQSASTAQLWGPAEKAAKDSAGRWTKAAEGFARKHGVSVDQLSFGAKTGTERHLLVEKPLPEEAAGAVLGGVIAETLRSLSFPKRMNWDAWLDDGKGSFPFGRPIRWIVALLDGEVVPFVIHGMVEGAKGEPIVASGSVTRGHRFLPKGNAGGEIPIGSLADHVT